VIVRSLHPRSEVDETRRLVEDYKVEFITLIDAHPTKGRDRWIRILDLLKANDSMIEASFTIGFPNETHRTPSK